MNINLEVLIEELTARGSALTDSAAARQTDKIFIIDMTAASVLLELANALEASLQKDPADDNLPVS